VNGEHRVNRKQWVKERGPGLEANRNRGMVLVTTSATKKEEEEEENRKKMSLTKSFRRQTRCFDRSEKSRTLAWEIRNEREGQGGGKGRKVKREVNIREINSGLSRKLGTLTRKR